MAGFARIPIVQLAVVVAIITAISWIVAPGPVAFVVSLAVTGVLALRAMADENDRKD